MPIRHFFESEDEGGNDDNQCNAMMVAMTSVPIVTKKMKKKVTIEFRADKDQTL